MESKQIFGIKLIAVINGIAALLHFLFWIIAFTRLPSISSISSIAEQMNLATTFGFGIADIVWSVPFLLLGSILLWKNKLIGWLGVNFANVLYWYSFTVIIIRDLSFWFTITRDTLVFTFRPIFLLGRILFIEGSWFVLAIELYINITV